jgi:hypothetical protein
MPSISVGGISRFPGVIMPSEEENPEPVTVDIAARRLGKQPATIRCWARRYAARKHGTYKGRTVYDWHDLSTIGACVHVGEPVPATPELRDDLRASLAAAA